jgi:polyferredoxin
VDSLGPWPGPADQAVLIDLANRRFFFFWIEIWPHEFYFVAGLLIMAGLGLFLFTSALGRVWCGYTCPQTVWTDLFILVERWIEGDRNAGEALEPALEPSKTPQADDEMGALGADRGRHRRRLGVLFRRCADAGARPVHILGPPVAYATVAILTATTFVFGGFMREQVCIYMCPWPRIQAAMMDEETITVAYRDWRGEPRGKHRKAEGADVLGDCIDCNACVNVCPVGIDIRDGQQLGCITCALCIDACDDVMAKIGKPRGLIDYMALSDEPRERAGGKPRVWRHVFRPRTICFTPRSGRRSVSAWCLRCSSARTSTDRGARYATRQSSRCPTARSGTPMTCGCATCRARPGRSPSV